MRYCRRRDFSLPLLPDVFNLSSLETDKPLFKKHSPRAREDDKKVKIKVSAFDGIIMVKAGHI